MISPLCFVCETAAESKHQTLEQEIDRLVYALYGLTAAEIKLVEESRK